jgi:hypothetical protein
MERGAAAQQSAEMEDQQSADARAVGARVRKDGRAGDS